MIKAKHCSLCGYKISFSWFKKLLILGVLVLAIVLGISFYHYTQKGSLTKNQPDLADRKTTGIQILPGIENIRYQEAQKIALKWSTSAKLCGFYTSVENLWDINPYLTYYFCTPKKQSSAYEVSGFLKDENFQTQETTNTNHKNFSHFPPPLLANKAINLADSKFRASYSYELSLKSVAVKLEAINNYWSVILNFGDRTISICKVYFDERAQCDAPAIVKQ